MFFFKTPQCISGRRACQAPDREGTCISTALATVYLPPATTQVHRCNFDADPDALWMQMLMKNLVLLMQL